MNEYYNADIDEEQINSHIKERKESNDAQEGENKIKFKFTSALCNQDQIKNEQIESLNKICSLLHTKYFKSLNKNTIYYCDNHF